MPATILRGSHELNIEVDKGSTLRRTVFWKTGQEGFETPEDLTDATADLVIRDSDNATLATLNPTLGGTDGSIEILITDEESNAFTFEKAEYIMVINYSNGETHRLFHGRFTVFD